MRRRTKWTLAILGVQVPLSIVAWLALGPWGLLPVLLICNAARIFWAESLPDEQTSPHR